MVALKPCLLSFLSLYSSMLLAARRLPFTFVSKAMRWRLGCLSFCWLFPTLPTCGSYLEFSISLGMMQNCPRERTPLSLKIKSEHSGLSFTYKIWLFLWHWREVYYIYPQTNKSSLSGLTNIKNIINIFIDKSVMKIINL